MWLAALAALAALALGSSSSPRAPSAPAPPDPSSREVQPPTASLARLRTPNLPPSTPQQRRALQSATRQQPRRAPNPRASSGAPGYTVYVVKRGETLSAIARRNRMSLGALLAANPQIRDPNAVAAGAKIRILASTATSRAAPRGTR